LGTDELNYLCTGPILFPAQVHPLLAKSGNAKDKTGGKKPQGRPPAKEKGKSKGK
jgi:hypothetical protein